jgi:hypothetical protein
LFREFLPLLVAGLVPFGVLALIVTGTALSLVSWQPPLLRTIQFGTENSVSAITAISSDSSGVYAAGFVGYRNVTPTYAFVNKYDLSGNQVWTQHLGDACCTQISSIAKGVDGVYAVGYLAFSFGNYSSFVRKYDLDGNQVWNRFGNYSGVQTSISADSTTLYVAGVNHDSQYYVEDYDLNGTPVWTHTLGNGNAGKIYLFASENSLYVLDAETITSPFQTGGSLIQQYGLDGVLSWNRTCSCDPTGITADSTGVYAMGIVRNSEVAGDGLLSRYDLNGNQLWTAQLSAPSFDVIGHVEGSVDSSGVYLAATRNNGVSVMKYDTSGNHSWSLELPWGYTGIWIHGEVITAQSEWVYVGGDLKPGASGSRNAFVAQIGKSSSLIFFGTNPPISFGIAGLLATATATSILWLRKRLKKRLRRSSAAMRYRTQKIPADMWAWA